MSQDINKVECTEQITKDCYCYVCVGGAFRRVKVSDLLALADEVTAESIAAALGYTPADPKKVEASGTAAKAIIAHNTEKTAHNDIRLLIEELSSKLAGLPVLPTVEVPVPIEFDNSKTYEEPATYRYTVPITIFMETPDGVAGYKIKTLGVMAIAGTTVKFVLYNLTVSNDNLGTLTKIADLGEATADNLGTSKGIAKLELEDYRIDAERFVIMAHAESASIWCNKYGDDEYSSMVNLPQFEDANYYNADEIHCTLTTEDNRVTYEAIPIMKCDVLAEMGLNRYADYQESLYTSLDKRITNLLPKPYGSNNGMFVQVVDGKYDLVAVTNGNEVKY